MTSAVAATTTSLPPLPAVPVRWRDVTWPKEHGSWSLAFEPVALGLMAAASPAGGALAVAVAAAFFARRPLRIAIVDAQSGRRTAARRALAGCALAGVVALAIAVVLAGPGWLPWLLPMAVLGTAFLAFDLRQGGREQLAEVLGTLAFAWLPAVFAILAGWTPALACALAALMMVRAVPTVLTIRAAVRARKTGRRQAGAALVSVGVGVVVAGGLVTAGLVAWPAALLAALLAARAFLLLVYPAPVMRPSRLGMIEAVTGVAYLCAVALTCNL